MVSTPALNLDSVFQRRGCSTEVLRYYVVVGVRVACTIALSVCVELPELKALGSSVEFHKFVCRWCCSDKTAIWVWVLVQYSTPVLKCVELRGEKPLSVVRLMTKNIAVAVLVVKFCYW